MGFCQFGCDFRKFRVQNAPYVSEKMGVVSSEAHLSFEIGSGFKNVAENQFNPCTIVHGFLSIWVRFSEFSKLVQNVP